MNPANVRSRAGSEQDLEARAPRGVRFALAGSRLAASPDRVALWAVVLAVAALLTGAASAHAGSGGTGSGERKACPSASFGDRSLQRGDCGIDVKTLNWILKSKRYGVPLDRDFVRRTDDAVRSFQRRKDLRSDGIVGKKTRGNLVRSLNRHQASWYGPGFWGNRTACGQKLRRKTVGVAHRRLPCGTRVVIGYKGRWLRTKVIDRGPYVRGGYTRDWDLTRKAARKLRFAGEDTVRAGKIRR